MTRNSKRIWAIAVCVVMVAVFVGIVLTVSHDRHRLSKADFVKSMNETTSDLHMSIVESRSSQPPLDRLPFWQSIRMAHRSSLQSKVFSEDYVLRGEGTQLIIRAIGIDQEVVRVEVIPELKKIELAERWASEYSKRSSAAAEVLSETRRHHVSTSDK